jgi:predicted amidohydrolase YtcJ
VIGRCRAAFVGVLLAASQAAAQVDSSMVSDILVLDNGRIWTGDSAQPEATGIVVQNGRIVRVLRGGETGDPGAGAVTARVRRIDLGGRRVVPGFNDSHTHFFDGGFTLLAPNTLATNTPEAFVRRLGEYAEALPEGRWINLSAAWDHERWPDHRLPSRWLIDSVTSKNPVWILRPDGHIGLANSLALERAGITRETPDPPGGAIDRDPSTGEPTGILRDASGLIARAIPPISEEALREALDAALAHAAQSGVTSIQDMCYDYGSAAVRLYQEYERTGRLSVRVYCRTSLADWRDAASLGVTAGFGSPWVRMGSLKEFADGAIGSSTAYFFDEYGERPGFRGLLDAVMTPADTFHQRAALADSARLQLSIHAIGDAAIALVLDQFEQIRAENPAWDRRWRIEHAQHMAAPDFERMAELGVIASVQPAHLVDDARFVERKIGRDRASRTYAFRSFLDAGVRLAFGTDWYVAPLDPWRTIQAAVTRIVPDVAPEGWFPEERITLEEAIAAYTRGSAYAEFADHEKGRLAHGYLADFVVLDRDPWELAPGELEGIETVLTIVGGRIVHAAGPFAPL